MPLNRLSRRFAVYVIPCVVIVYNVFMGID